MDGDELFELKDKLDLDVDEALEVQKKIETRNEMLAQHAKEQLTLKNEIEDLILKEMSKDDTERELLSKSSGKKKKRESKTVVEKVQSPVKVQTPVIVVEEPSSKKSKTKKVDKEIKNATPVNRKDTPQSPSPAPKEVQKEVIEAKSVGSKKSAKGKK